MEFKGTALHNMFKGHGPWEFEVLKIHPSKHHTILYEFPLNLLESPKPHISSQQFHFDDGYVKMPYSSRNLFPSKDTNGQDILVSRWNLICKAYEKPIKDSEGLERAINSYNNNLPKFVTLQQFLDEEMTEEESEHFYSSILPGIINLALKLPDIVPGSIPLLKADTCKSISLSQKQIASLLANAFLCAFPWRKDVAPSYPGINFHSLFSATRKSSNRCVIEKLKCIILYFRKIIEKDPVGVVTFERQHIRKANMPRWDKLENNLGNTRLHVTSKGTIENDGLGMLQVDFANKFIGGGVLGRGCVQEEIRFIICPEMIISRLFTEKLNNNESLIITGAERFSKYTGYADNFEWDGYFKDETPFDPYGRRMTTLVAIDATPFPKPEDQFNSSSILRELNKAYAGFYSRFSGSLPPVATGNWGCGAFRGDPCLKFLIQFMACNAARRDMTYFTFEDADLRDNIYNMYTFIATNQITIGTLWRLMCRFISTKLAPDNFYPFIQQGFFDLKKQPPIKKMFQSFFPKPEETVPIPSTSRDEKTEIEKMDVSINSEDIREKSPIIKRKCVKPDDVIDLINKIDGKENIKSSKKCEGGLGTTFLECVDEYSKQNCDGVIEDDLENADEQMDIEEILDNLEENSVKIKPKIKRKITDYFSKC